MIETRIITRDSCFCVYCRNGRTCGRKSMAITRPGHVLHTLFVRPPLSHAEPPLLKKSPALLLLLVSFLLFSLGTCSAGTSSTTVPPKASVPAARHLSPTPTSLPAGTVLYQANWSHGPPGRPGATGWKEVQGRLVSASSGTATFTIPYRPTVSDYAVEVPIQIIRSVPPYGGYYEIAAPKLAGKDGYHAGVLDLKAPGLRPFGAHPQSQVYLDPFGDMNQGRGIPHDYEPG